MFYYGVLSVCFVEKCSEQNDEEDVLSEVEEWKALKMKNVGFVCD